MSRSFGSSTIVIVIGVIVLGSLVWAGQMLDAGKSDFLGTAGVVLQNKRNNCGPAALKMILDHHGIPSSLGEIEGRISLTRRGASMLALKEAAESMGLSAEGWRYTMEDLPKAPFPAILYVNGDHFIVADSIVSGRVFVRDPAVGKLRLQRSGLLGIWEGETLLIWRSPEPHEE
jgi:ABC-type bacteriocin/lantibiotic exporter with double-glycine peptidase domain